MVDLAASWVRPLFLAVGLGGVAAAGTLVSADATTAARSVVLRHAVIGGIVALMVAVAVVRSHRHPLVRRVGVPTVLTVVVAIGALTGAAAASRPADPGTPQVIDTPVVVDATGSGSGGTAISPASRDERIATADITDVQGMSILAAGLALLVAAAWFLMQRSELRAVARSGVFLGSDLVLDEPEDATDDELDERRLAEALRRAARLLDGGDDHRGSIRAAYGALLDELARHGRGRLRHEGPFEHVHRVLDRSTLPQADVVELVELFAVARFSTHEVTADHVDRARFLLVACTDHLDRPVVA